MARDVTAAAFAEAWRQPGLSADQQKVALTAAVRRGTMAARSGALRVVPRAVPRPPMTPRPRPLLDRLVVRDDLTDLGDPDRNVMLQLINEQADRGDISRRLGMDPSDVSAIVARSLRTMRTRLAGSRGAS